MPNRHLGDLPLRRVQPPVLADKPSLALSQRPHIHHAVHIIRRAVHHILELVPEAVDLLRIEAHHHDWVVIKQLQVVQLHIGDVQHVGVSIAVLQAQTYKYRILQSMPRVSAVRTQDAKDQCHCVVKPPLEASLLGQEHLPAGDMPPVYEQDAHDKCQGVIEAL